MTTTNPFVPEQVPKQTPKGEPNFAPVFAPKPVLGLLVLPLWQKLSVTFLFSLCVTLGLVILSFMFQDKSLRAWHDWSAWVYWSSRRFSFALAESFAVYLLFEISARLIGVARILNWQSWQRFIYFVSVPLVGVVMGWRLAVWAILEYQPQLFYGFDYSFGPVFPATIFMSLLLMFVVYHFWSARYQQAEAERRATEAQLRMLQAQIEPHFLFNTLANVVSLIDYDAAKSKHMLETFIDYLRASLGSTRRERVELDEELALVESYLKLLQIRMDDRLRYVINVSADVRHAEVPPLTLQPLVENAIVHGIEPKIEGGTIHIKAEARDRSLFITVSDDGIGLNLSGSTSGNGLALQNIRERIAGQFGSAAELHIEAHPQSGTIATLRLPFHREST